MEQKMENDMEMETSGPFKQAREVYRDSIELRDPVLSDEISS